MRTLIVGCGYVGTALGEALVHRGDEVTGICRSAETAAALRSRGIEPIAADIAAPGSFRTIPTHFDVVIDTVSSVRRGEDAYREVYGTGSINLLEWAEQKPPRVLVFTSSTTVYAQATGEPVDETSPAEPPHTTGKILIEAERLFLGSKLPAMVLRLAAIYGPGRHAMLDRLRNGVTVLPGDGRRYVNSIHRDDVVSVILAAIDHPMPGETLNVSDDEPVPESDYVRWICDQLKLTMPSFDPSMEPRFKGGMRKGFLPNRRVSNRKMKQRLGVRLRFPTFREGLLPLL